MEKFQIRKCQKYTIWESTEVATIDPEKFRNLSIPFEGETEEDFINYISDIAYDVYEILDELDGDTAKELDKMFDYLEWTEYSNSAYKFEDSWFEIGEADEGYTKTGGFNSRFDTLNEY